MSTEQSREFMRSGYEKQRESAWKELRDLILPAVVIAAAGTLAYKGFNKLKGMPSPINLPAKLSKEQEVLKEYQKLLKASHAGAESDIPYQTSKMFEDWMRGRKKYV